MANRPAFLFYPSDWLSNLKLRQLTPAERGAWIDLLCLMHDSDEYGVIRWDLENIAKVINCDVALLENLVRQNTLKGARRGEVSDAVFHVDRYRKKHVLMKKSEGPVWYSSRMIRDNYLHALAKRSGRKGWRTLKGTLKGDTEGVTEGAPDNENDNEDTLNTNKELSAKKSRRTFSPPTVDQVSEYCRERSNQVDAQRFVDYYESNGWMVGKNRMRDWRACVRTWERNGLHARAGPESNDPRGNFAAAKRYAEQYGSES